MSTPNSSPSSHIGLRLDDQALVELIEEQGSDLRLVEDRFSGNVEVLSHDSLQELMARAPMDDIKEALYQIWEGVGGEVMRALKFDVYVEGESMELALILEVSNFKPRKSALFTQFGILEPRDPLPVHTTLPCEGWNGTWAGLVVPDNFAIGIEGVSVFTLQPGGKREAEDIL